MSWELLSRTWSGAVSFGLVSRTQVADQGRLQGGAVSLGLHSDMTRRDVTRRDVTRHDVTQRFCTGPPFKNEPFWTFL